MKDGFAWYDKINRDSCAPDDWGDWGSSGGRGSVYCNTTGSRRKYGLYPDSKRCDFISPVAAEGALLSMGDFHAVMGEGEIEDCGLEIEGQGYHEGDCCEGLLCSMAYD